jgi:uncharacterized protein involved in response to NO
MTIPLALARRRDYAGPALFAYGFRPLFLGAAIWAAGAILLWIPVYSGEIALPISMGPLDWHMHEMLYGFVAATMAGFLLTAIPNWTGRLPVSGLSLAALFGLWIGGRAAGLTSALIGAVPAALIDVSFLIALAAVALREIIAGRNWRNLRVLAGLGLFATANVLWHIEILRTGAGDYGPRMAIAAVILMITLIGGRIVPSFTHNWLVRMNPGRLPIPFARFDAIAIVLAALALLMWIALPHHVVTGIALVAAGVIHTVRLSRWAGDRTLADRLVLVLHVAYAFVPTGFVLLGTANLWPALMPDSAAIHAWTAGAIGLMTLAVMTRASLGHTGQALKASPATQAIYALAVIGALARIAAACTASFDLMHVAAFAWIAAFGGFAIIYGKLLVMHPPAWAAKS